MVRERGKRFRTAHLEVRYVSSPQRDARVGIIVPLYAHAAVARNRLKRRLREIVRVDVLPSLGGMDVVVRAWPSAYHATFAELRAQCLRARDELGGTSDR